jgi:hypothetical protein
MAGGQLHAFDLDLSEYVLGQLRPHLRSLRERTRRPFPELDYDEFHRLTLPEWLGRGVAFLPEPLADHIWAGVTGDPVVLPLNDAELVALAGLVDDPPMRCEDECVWEPYPALHRRYVESVPEIQAALTQPTAEEWATESAAFTAQLCEEGLSLVAGIDTAHRWLWCVRRLLKAMGTTHYLPAPVGFHPTPTIPQPAAAPPSDPAFDEERFAEVVADLRKAISDLPCGITAKADDVIGQAMVQRQIGRKALRWLERRGEYRGFARKTPSRYRRNE